MNDVQEFTAAPVTITATTLPPHDLVMGVANVLDGARTIALRKWDKDRCDLYHVAERAWRAQAMVVPLAAVTAQLRRVVPDGKLLTYQDQEGRTRADVAAKFTEAREALLAGNTALARQTGDVQAPQREDSARAAAPLIVGDNEDEPPTTAVTNISLAHLLGLDLSDDQWQRKSLCAQTDPEAFFPEKRINPRREAHLPALPRHRRLPQRRTRQRRTVRDLGRPERARASAPQAQSRGRRQWRRRPFRRRRRPRRARRGRSRRR